MRDHPLYDMWTAMHQRCTNPNNSHFHLYGQRGISVCAEWRDFAVFVADMGSRPDGMTIDRIDNDGNYCAINCRWATPKRQARNQRKTCMVEWNGKRVALADLAETRGIKLTTAYSRLVLKGWTVAQAIGEDAAPKAADAPMGAARRGRKAEALRVSGARPITHDGLERMA